MMVLTYRCSALLNEEKVGRHSNLRKVCTHIKVMSLMANDSAMYSVDVQYLSCQCATCQCLFAVSQYIAEQPSTNEMNCFR